MIHLDRVSQFLEVMSPLSLSRRLISQMLVNDILQMSIQKIVIMRLSIVWLIDRLQEVLKMDLLNQTEHY